MAETESQSSDDSSQGFGADLLCEHILMIGITARD